MAFIQELPAGSNKGFCSPAVKKREQHCSPPEHRDFNSQHQGGNKSAAINKGKTSVKEVSPEVRLFLLLIYMFSCTLRESIALLESPQLVSERHPH